MLIRVLIVWHLGDLFIRWFRSLFFILFCLYNLYFVFVFICCSGFLIFDFRVDGGSCLICMLIYVSIFIMLVFIWLLALLYYCYVNAYLLVLSILCLYVVGLMQFIYLLHLFILLTMIFFIIVSLIACYFLHSDYLPIPITSMTASMTY